MMTGDQYRTSLQDGRVVYRDGKRILDITEDPILKLPIDIAADLYDETYEAGEGNVRSLIKTIKSADDLRAHSRKMEEADMLLEVTSASLMTLLTAAGRLEAKLPENAARIRAYVEQAQKADIRIAQCITDGKGDRSKSPGAQEDPDAYTHVVERRPDGVVIRGSKLHITAGSICHDLLTIPTKSMKPGEDEYSIACAIPANSPGVKLIDVDYAIRHADDRRFPITSRSHTPDTFVIFDDVFVPNERIFLNGHPELAGTFAHSLGLWERIGGLSLMAQTYDQLVGFAQLVAEANGTEKIAHIKEKISDMIISATLVRGSLEAAIANCNFGPDGSAFPNELHTNAGKFYAAANYTNMVRTLHDIAGGSVQTAPSVADLESEEVGHFVRKYMGTKQSVDGDYRTRLFHAIYDLTAGPGGSWRAIALLQSGGGLYAQRIVSRGHYDMDRAKRIALELGHLTGPAA